MAVRRAGFTLIELLISLAILAAMLGALGLAVERGMGMFRMRSATSDVETRAARALDRIVREIRAAGAGTVTDVTTPPMAPKFWLAAVDYRPALGWTAGAVDLGAPRRIELGLVAGEAANGLDDNENGLVDEREVVLVDDVGAPGERRTVLAARVASLLGGELANGLDDNGNGLVDESGLCFDQEGDLLTVRLCVQGVGPTGEAISRTFQDAVVLRN
jgi:prepilin-type N-terminal cleavage/methylation domain-containing protein